jgi:DNA-directed RNA polymerase II subunit RPB11
MPAHGMLIYNNDISPDSLVDMPGDRKVREEQCAKAENTSIFYLEKEDHTVANILRMKLHQNPQVKMAGYRVPHPTQHTVEIRVQTGSDGDPKKAVPTPLEAFRMAIDGALDDVQSLEDQLTAALAAYGWSSEHKPLHTTKGAGAAASSSA